MCGDAHFGARSGTRAILSIATHQPRSFFSTCVAMPILARVQEPEPFWTSRHTSRDHLRNSSLAAPEGFFLALPRNTSGAAHGQLQRYFRHVWRCSFWRGFRNPSHFEHRDTPAQKLFLDMCRDAHFGTGSGNPSHFGHRDTPAGTTSGTVHLQL